VSDEGTMVDSKGKAVPRFRSVLDVPVPENLLKPLPAPNLRGGETNNLSAWRWALRRAGVENR
jgi:hypothetical protein